MSQENVKIVRSASITISSQAAELPGVPAVQSGHDGVLESFALWPGSWDDFWIEIARIADLGDQVLVTTDQGGRSKETGIEVNAQFTFLFTLRDGKITEWRIFLRESEALEAAQPQAWPRSRGLRPSA